jgi:hypothetical protein
MYLSAYLFTEFIDCSIDYDKKYFDSCACVSCEGVRTVPWVCMIIFMVAFLSYTL